MKITTVIIDDHTLFNDGLSLILKESTKFKVIKQVYDSRQALHTCARLNPDLILVDYNMPYLDGLEVINQLKQANLKAKILVITMYVEEEMQQLFKNTGIDGFLSKTMPSNLMINYLDKVMKGSKVPFPKSEKKSSKKDSFADKHRLTKRELDILHEIKKGLTSQEVADKLGLKYYTVETHRKNINRKMNFESKNDFYVFLNQL